MVDALGEVTSTATTLLKEEQDRVETLERQQAKTLTKKDRKAVLFDYKGVKRINADTIIERPDDMRMLRDVIAQVSEAKNFRIPEASKGASYSCDWGAREDGMLCVGIVRHGFGAWVQIRDDLDLNLSDKLFLEEHRVEKKEQRTKHEEKGVKSPGAVHLVRRAEYLISVLKEKTSNGTNLAAKRAVENHHRNNKKSGLQPRHPNRPSNNNSASPAPAAGHKRQRESERPRQRTGTEARTYNGDTNGHTSRSDARPRASSNHIRREVSRSQNSPHRHHRPSNEHAPDGVRTHDHLIKMCLVPVEDSLQAVQHANKFNIPDRGERALALKDGLRSIGVHVKGLIKPDSPAGLEDDFW